MWDDALLALAGQTLAACRARQEKVALVESCTGGLVTALLTAIPGSSDVVERSFVTYSNQAKSELVGVPPALIAAHGAVSAAVATAMAEGGLARSAAQRCVAITGVAGPGASERKPAGLVFLALARTGAPTQTSEHRFSGDRGAVRAAAAREALKMLAL